MDNSQSDQLMVRTSDGKEGYIPTLCCLLPVPDKSPKSTAERLSIQLLVSWTETVRKAKPMIISCVTGCIQNLYDEWIDIHTSCGKERITRRLRRIKEVILETEKLNLSSLHNALFSVENEMSEWMLSQRMENLLRLKSVISNLDKTVLCYQTFRKQWHVFRKILRSSHTPIRLVNSIAALRANRQNAIVKYYELRLTVTRHSYRDERVHITRSGVVGFTATTVTSDIRDGLTGQTVTVDQINQIESEEHSTYVIDYVVRPDNGQRISFADAVATGLIDIEAGVYRQHHRAMAIATVDGDVEATVDVATAGDTAVATADATAIATANATTVTLVDATAVTTADAMAMATAGSTAVAILGTTAVTTANDAAVTTADAMAVTTAGAMAVTTLDDASQSLSIREAIASGAISVSRRSESGERRVVSTSVGVVTARQDTRKYRISAVADAVTGERLTQLEARSRGLLNGGLAGIGGVGGGGGDDEEEVYTVNTTGEKMHVRAAIAKGWIKAEFENGDLYSECQYAISHVVDQKRRILLSFRDAIMKQLFSIRTAQYTNNVTGEKMGVMQAIRKGYIKAERVKDNNKHSLVRYKECIETHL